MWKLVIVAMLLCAPAWGQEPQVIKGKSIVLDGDTLLFGDTRVRLWGIDAPEMKDWPLGQYARAHLENPVGNSDVYCNIKDRDRDRLVGVCFRGKDGRGRELATAMLARCTH